ncbi:MAG: M28 family peptidase [Bacteroidota bacterium]
MIATIIKQLSVSFSLLVACIFLSSHLFGQNDTLDQFDLIKFSEENITIDGLESHIRFLAADSLLGRAAFSEDERKAANYICERLEDYGVKSLLSGEKPFLQTFAISGGTLIDTILIKNPSGIDFSLNSNLVIGDFEFNNEKGKLIFGGNLGDTTEWTGLEIKNLKGNFLVVFEGAEKGANKREKFSFGAEKFRAIVEMAIKSNAKGVFFISPYSKGYHHQLEIADFRNSMKRGDMLREVTGSSNFGIFCLPLSKGGKLLGLSQKVMKVKIDSFYSGKRILLVGKRDSISITTIGKQGVVSQNVLGFIPGGKKKKEFIAIVGHYDHVGFDGPQIYNGADDNASGISVLLSLANTFAELSRNGISPNRSILFIAFGAEEVGLLGSFHYARNPVFPIENIRGLVNFDMVGRLQRNHSLNDPYRLFYTASNEMLKEAIEIRSEYSSELVFKGVYNNPANKEYLYSRSDHFPFARLGVPFIHFFSGFHDDYHTPSDTIDKINFDGLEELAEFTFKFVWHLANQ